MSRSPRSPRARARLTSRLSAALLLSFSALGLAAGPEQGPDDGLADARRRVESGDLRGATVELRGRLQQDPNDALARALLAQVYLDLRNGKAAEDELRRVALAQVLDAGNLAVPLTEALLLQGRYSAVIEDPGLESADDPLARATLHAIRAEAYLGLDDPEGAGVEIARALEVHPRLGRAILVQARMALAKGHRDRALELVQAAIEADPAEPRAWNALGEMEYNAGRYRESAEAFGRAIALGGPVWLPQYKRALALTELDRLAEAGADLDAAEREFPAFAGIPYARAALRLRQDDPEQAFAEMSLFLRSFPDRPEAAYLAGAALYRLGRHVEAEEYLGRAYKATPGSLPAAAMLARNRLALGNARSAEEVLSPFMEGERPPPEAQQLMAQALGAQGRSAESRAAINKLAAAAPEDPATRLATVQLMIREGDKETAERELLAMAASFAPGSKESETARLLLVRFLLDDGRAPAAVEEARALAAAQPESPRAHNALGGARRLAGDEAGARQSLGRALELDPGLGDAARNLARLELNAGRLDQALAVYERSLAANPKGTEVLLDLVQLEALQGRKSAGMERLKTALAADPENVELRENLARGYRSAGQVKEAARLLQEAPPGAGAHPRLLMLRAELDLESGQPFNAVSTLERLVASQPGSADAHFMLANAFAAAKNATGMKEQLIAGCRIDRDSGLAGPTLELVFRSLPDTAAKRALAEELKGLGGEVPGLDLAQARLDLAEGQFQQGLGRLVSLNKTRPTDRAVLVELIGAQAKGGDLFSATQSAQTWLKRHPKDPQVTGLLAQLYLKRGRTDKAIDTYRELLAALPQDPVANNNLANLLLPTDPATALTHARKASASAPGDPAIADTLGQALLAAGDAKGAVEALAQAQAGLPNEPAVALHYASALAAAGDRARAKSVLLPILDKSFPEKAQAQALLATLVGR